MVKEWEASGRNISDSTTTLKHIFIDSEYVIVYITTTKQSCRELVEHKGSGYIFLHILSLPNTYHGRERFLPTSIRDEDLWLDRDYELQGNRKKWDLPDEANSNWSQSCVSLFMSLVIPSLSLFSVEGFYPDRNRKKAIKRKHIFKLIQLSSPVHQFILAACPKKTKK